MCKMWKWWIKKQRVLCVCMRDEKSWNIEPKNTKIFIFKLEKSWNIESNETKSQYLICS